MFTTIITKFIYTVNEHHLENGATTFFMMFCFFSRTIQQLKFMQHKFIGNVFDFIEVIIECFRAYN